MLHSRDTIAIPPGATIREQLESRKISQKEFAQRMDMSEKHISHLINGKVELTHETALRLESVLGIPARFWNNMESLYREQEARAREELALEHDETMASKMPYSECAKLGWIQPTRKIAEKVHNLRRFFEVANLKVLEDMQVPGIAYRAVGESISSAYAQAMWAQKAKLDAREVQTDAININQLKASISQVRALTTSEPEDFCVELKSLFAKCGIALVFLPHLNGSFLHGATFIDGNHIVLGLTVRGKYADTFWFSLFHELGHIIHGHISSFADINENNELEANYFAQNTLIPTEKYREFLERNDFSKGEIQYFANIIGIAPGIILGRLQKENYIPYSWHNELKVMYRLSD